METKSNIDQLAVGDRRKLLVVGRFPPPVDGQSLLTARSRRRLSIDFDVEGFNVGLSKKVNPFRKILHYVLRSKSLSKCTEDFKPDITIWSSISPQLIAHLRDLFVLIPRLKNVPVIAVVHWGNFDKLFRSPITYFTSKRLVERLDKIVFLDEHLAASCSNWISKDKLAVIPNPLDPETICSDTEVARKLATGPGRPFNILFLGNMIRTKGYLDVLRSARILKDAGLNFVVNFVGGWHESRKEFDSFCDELDLKDVIRHHGLVADRATIKQFHLNAHAFVLPTYYPTEAQPSSMIEALSAATPIVTCRQGGIPQMVRGGIEAIFVKPRDPRLIASAILEFSKEDVWRSMASGARKRYLDCFDDEVIHAKWNHLILSVIESRKNEYSSPRDDV